VSGGRAGRRATARGDLRREQLVEAACDLLAEEGFAAVSHRAVARRAGVPLAATTYYFASREELVAEALRRLGDRWLARGRERATAPGGGTAAERVVAAVAGGSSRADLVTFYERYVQAARTPAWGDVVRGWTDALVELVAAVLAQGGADPAAARRVVGLVDGLLLAALAEGRPDPAAGLAAEVEALLRGPGRRP